MLRLKYGGVLAIFFLSVFCTSALAQDSAANKFFIYIQNENGSPFYLKKDNSLMSSSPAGYMIIPQLAKGQYKFTIGFPGNQSPEESFDVSLNGLEDKGFLLKKKEDGFALFSLRDLKVLEPLAVASAPGNRIVNVPAPSQSRNTKNKNTTMVAANDDHQPVAIMKPHSDQKQPTTQAATLSENTPKSTDDSDAFSKMLNEITGTSKSKPAAVTPKKQVQTQDSQGVTTAEKPVNEVKIPAEETNVNHDQDINLQTDNTIVPAEETHPKKREHHKKSEPQFITFTPDAAQMNTAQDEALPTAGAGIDTDTESKRQQRKLRKAQRRAEKEAERRQDSLLENEPLKNEAAAPLESITHQNNNESGNGELKSNNVQPGKINGNAAHSAAIANSDCQHLANEDDFQKVRRKMASRGSEESMYHTAQKYFSGGTCYSTAQIQSLTYLFMTDEYRYKFLELAYPHIYDSKHFLSLEKTLGSDYYKGRFKAMIK